MAEVIFILTQTAPLWVTFILLMVFWHEWVDYVRAEFIFKQEHKLLQIKLPTEMFKSPLSMELFLTTLHQTGGEGTWYDKYWLGKSRAWFTLEMVSLEAEQIGHERERDMLECVVPSDSMEEDEYAHHEIRHQ